MLLMLVGKYRDKSYCVLDMHTGKTDKMTEEQVKQAIKCNCVGNAHLAWYNKSLVKGNYMSLTRLKYVEDVERKPKYMILCSSRSQGKNGYLMCRQDGKSYKWVSYSVVRYNMSDFVNVSAYLSRCEDTCVVSCKGYVFPCMDELLSEKTLQQVYKKEEEEQEEPVKLQIDIKGIQEQRREKLRRMKAMEDGEVDEQAPVKSVMNGVQNPEMPEVYRYELDEILREYAEKTDKRGF